MIVEYNIIIYTITIPILILLLGQIRRNYETVFNLYNFIRHKSNNWWIRSKKKVITAQVKPHG